MSINIIIVTSNIHVCVCVFLLIINFHTVVFCMCLCFAWPSFPCKGLTLQIVVSLFAGLLKINPSPPYTHTNGVGVLLFNYYTYRWSCLISSVTQHCLPSDWPFCCWCFGLHANCKLPILPNFKTVQHSGNCMCHLFAHKQSLHFPTQCTYVPHESHNNQLVFVMEMHHVLCDVETEFLTTLLYVTLLYICGLHLWKG
jgi:hypothetical protein